MRLGQGKSVESALIGVSLAAGVACLALAVLFARLQRSDAIQAATHDLATRAAALAERTEADLATFDVVLRDAARQGREPGPPAAPLRLLDLPAVSRYVGFVNVLDTAGDVVADARGAVTRLTNFAGRDYFQDQLKNPADTLRIGRPFGTAPGQHASIPLSRRLTRPDGGFDGVVVAGVRLEWLNDRLALPMPGPEAAITVRRDDGMILMRAPYDVDAIGRTGADDAAWRDWQRDATSPVTDPSGRVTLFHRLTGAPLVLEVTLAPASVPRGPGAAILPFLGVVPGVCVVVLAVIAVRSRRRVARTEAGALAANDDRMRLLATMSHELRSPLTAVLGHAGLMADEGGLTEGQADRLARVTDAAAAMRIVVNRVIDLARPEECAEMPELTACDLDALVRSSLGMVEVEACRKGLRLVGDIDLGTPKTVVLAADFVRRVLVNLLMNAVRYTSEGSVALRMSGNAAQLRFEVADTGPGITPAKRGRLFRAFDRLDAPARADASGLGLSIAGRLVRRMGGEIWHRDNQGGGSVFCFDLPVGAAHGPAGAARQKVTGAHVPAGETPRTAGQTGGSAIVPPIPPEARRQSGEPPGESLGAAPALEGRRLHLLLADDLDLTRDVTAAYLRAAGHVVTEVADGGAALAALRERDFDAVLADMRMPIVDGVELARRVRALAGPRGRTPILLVTADLSATDAARSPGSAIDACLLKPFTRVELLSAVAGVTERARDGAGPVPDTPMPDTPMPDTPMLDDAVLDDLRASLGARAFATQFEAAERRVAALADLLARPGAAHDPAVREAVHDLIGVAGLFGLATLSACLRRFDRGLVRDVAPPLAAARYALDALRKHRADTAQSGAAERPVPSDP